MDKKQDWWNSLGPQIQKQLKSQPLWHGRDMAKVAVIGSVIGYLIRWAQSV